MAPQPKMVSQPEVVLSPSGHLAMSGDIADGHTGGFLWTPSEWGPGCCSYPPMKVYLSPTQGSSPNINSAEIEKPRPKITSDSLGL